MQVNIKKNGKKKRYNVISSWDDVTLEKWAKLINNKNKSKSKDAIDTIKALSDIPTDLIKELSINDISKILSKIAQLQASENTNLKRIITVDNIDYGFHPNLEEITLGEYADIETHIQNGFENNLPKLMSVLYRPIIEKEGKYYTIKAYDSSTTQLRAEKFKKMKARDVNSALLFFWTFVKELSIILPLYLMEVGQKMMDNLHRKNLQKNGVGLE
tara:strand:+ start:826 stop:1470 length:645 start_codon:yes stop_codon:yes gene_type:complete